MYSLPQNDSNASVWLTIDGEEYELSQFNIGFAQSCDHKGEPQNEVRGGLMQVVLSQTVPESIYAWAMRKSTKSGVVDFRIESGSATMKIEFNNAFCVGFRRVINSEGGGLLTALTVSPEELLINGISFDNHWVNH